MAFLGFCKASDRAEGIALFVTLRRNKVPECLVQAISQLYIERTVRICMGTGGAKSVSYSCGIILGDSLSALLYVI